MRLRVIVFLCAVTLASIPAFGTPTSLNAVPTADVLACGQANLAVQFSGGRISGDYDFFNQFQTEFGFGKNIELGVDFSIGPNTGNPCNAKYRIYDETKHRPAIAIGQYVDLYGTGNPPYITSYKRIGTSRLHFGATRIDQSIRALAGYDLWHGRPFTLQADYVSGPRTYASIGFVLNLRDGFSINAAQLIGNSDQAPNAYMVIAGWTGQLFGKSASDNSSLKKCTGRQKVIILAHRGESYIAPENTLSAFNLAWKNGAKAVELDVHMSRDNKIVVMHDDSTTRTSGVEYIISKTDSAELRKLDVGRWKSEQYAGEKIPFLEEALATIPPRCIMFVEVKCGLEALPYIRDIIDKSGKRSQVAIISFSLDVVSASKKLMADIPHYWLRSPRIDSETKKDIPYDNSLIKIAKENNLDGLDLQYYMLTKEFADEIKASGLSLWTWNTNTPEKAQYQIDMGVDGFTTDRCGWMLDQLK